MSARVLALLLGSVVCATPALLAQSGDLPPLHVIRRFTLSPSYSCRPASELEKGYQATALFLTDSSRLHNSPELRFDGACGAPDTFESHTPDTDDMSLVADLGPGIPIETVSAWRAFNPRGLDLSETYARFARQVPVQLGHTYAVLLDDHERRGLLVFSVEGYVPNRRVDLRLVVKHYQVLAGVSAESPGFGWETGSVEPLGDVWVRRSGDLLVLEKEVLLPVSPDRAWAAFTDPREMRAWMGAGADVELRPGGRYDGQGLSGAKVLSVVPGEMLSHTGGFPMSGSGWSVWRFAAAGTGRTRVSFQGFLPGGGASESTRGAEGLTPFLTRLLARFGQPSARAETGQAPPPPARQPVTTMPSAPEPSRTPRLGRVTK